GGCLLRAEAEGLHAVRVLLAVEARIDEVVDILRGAWLGGERRGLVPAALQRFAVLVGRLRVGAEVVVEGDVFWVDDHDVLDGGLRLRGRGLCRGHSAQWEGCHRRQRRRAEDGKWPDRTRTAPILR